MTWRQRSSKDALGTWSPRRLGPKAWDKGADTVQVWKPQAQEPSKAKRPVSQLQQTEPGAHLPHRRSTLRPMETFK